MMWMRKISYHLPINKKNKTEMAVNAKLFLSFLYKLENKLPRQANIWVACNFYES